MSYSPKNSKESSISSPVVPPDPSNGEENYQDSVKRYANWGEYVQEYAQPNSLLRLRQRLCEKIGISLENQHQHSIATSDRKKTMGVIEVAKMPKTDVHQIKQFIREFYQEEGFSIRDVHFYIEVTNQNGENFWADVQERDTCYTIYVSPSASFSLR